MAGKYFDEYEVGEEHITPSRTLTETDVVMFAAMTGDYNELHTSAEFMKHSQFGRRLVHGLLLFRLGLFEGTAIAFLGIESWKFEAPLFFGDTVRVRVQVAETRASRSKPDRGIVKFFLQILNQDEVVVQSGYKTIMFRRKTGG